MTISTTFLFATVAALGGCAVKVPSPGFSAGTRPQLEAREHTMAVGGGDAEYGRGGDDDSSGGGQAPTYDETFAAELAAARVDPDRGTCSAEAVMTARHQGLVGTCWDPPGDEAFAPPVHVVAGPRQMADDLYWFDMPREATVDPNYRCALLPGTLDHQFPYDPYSGDGGRAVPSFPRLDGLTVTQALAALDRLDAPLCVELITWTTSCPVEAGHVCQHNFDANHGKLNLIVRADD